MGYNKNVKNIIHFGGDVIMQKRKWKADEMEMAINFKSIRVAYIFSIVTLLGYCIYSFAIQKELPFVPFIVLSGQLFLFYFSKIYLTRKMARGNKDEE